LATKETTSTILIIWTVPDFVNVSLEESQTILAICSKSASNEHVRLFEELPSYWPIPQVLPFATLTSMAWG